MSKLFSVLPLSIFLCILIACGGSGSSSTNKSSTIEQTNQISSLQENDELTHGLIAYYPFTDSANDESGNGHHGTVDGATPTTDITQNSNRAYVFDGEDDYKYLTIYFLTYRHCDDTPKQS